MSNGVKVFKRVRQYCLECGGGSTKEVRFCTCADCPLWPMRFGCSPPAAVRRLGPDGKALLDESNFREGSVFGPEKSVAELETEDGQPDCV